MFKIILQQKDFILIENEPKILSAIRRSKNGINGIHIKSGLK